MGLGVVQEFVANNTCAVVYTAAGTLVAFASGTVLGVIGFGPEGVIGGSWAATVQSWVGNVPNGSVFSWLQSASAGKGAARTAAAFAKGVGLGGIVGCFLANARNSTGIP
ncbi:hypothetical protein N657DRAFT_275278 [Parathielavia appendiculata]|uniref:Uncharacterized protein n=1 Tax=Parathielavia appendiculata TaxID=2587402 RepID=A0AAN6U4B2_9PEZI|nr:hypothetical protein N657DRAFT_275278 [Parathielavia appendiculata]